jgi:hypothetical protein
MTEPRRPSKPIGILHRLVSRADAREALAWFVLIALAFPPWRAFEIEGGADGWVLEAWPYAVMAGMTLVAISALASALSQRGNVTDPEQPGAAGNGDQSAIARPAWLIILCSAAYVMMVGKLGFLLASPLFLAAVIVIQGSRHWPTIVGASIGIPIIVVVVVTGLSGLPLPLGVGPFLDLGIAIIGMPR